MNTKEQLREQIVKHACNMKLGALAREYRRAKADNRTEFAAILRAVLTERNKRPKRRPKVEFPPNSSP